MLFFSDGMKLPSKKVLSLLLITVSFVVFTVLVFGKKNTAGQQILSSTLRAGDKVDLPNNTNWQDILTTNNIYEQSTTPTSTSSISDQISISLISNYLQLKQSDALTPENTQKIIDLTTSSIINSSQNQIESAELNIVPDNGRQTIVNYAEDLGKVFKENRPKEVKNEIQIITKALESGDEKNLLEINSIIEVYDTLILDMKSMYIPKTFQKSHLDMVNGLIHISTSLKSIKDTYNNPFGSVSALSSYQNGVNVFLVARKATVDFIIKNKINYEQGSGGYYLLYGI